MPRKMLTTAEAAEALGYEPDTLRGWRLRGIGPRYYKINARAVRYDQKDIENYVNERLVVPCGGGIERSHATR